MCDSCADPAKTPFPAGRRPVTIHWALDPTDAMTAPDSSDPRATFEYLSGEYAQALQAWAAIETQAATLVLMGYTDEFRQFIDQFIEMASRTRALAAERHETNFADWFGELIDKAEKLKQSAPR